MNTKTCPDCEETKPISEFYLSYKDDPSRGYHTYCKPCSKIRNREYGLANRKRLSKYKQKMRHRSIRYVYEYLLNHPCINCGEDDPIVLDFDHIDPETKTKGISEYLSMAVSIDTIQSEIDKCEVRCSNCHRRKTAKEQDWLMWQWGNGLDESLVEVDISPPRPTHCPQGHSYDDEDNLAYTSKGWMYCKECKRIKALEYYYNKKQAT